jgi:hypothetical protein
VESGDGPGPRYFHSMDVCEFLIHLLAIGSASDLDAIRGGQAGLFRRYVRLGPDERTQRYLVLRLRRPEMAASSFTCPRSRSGPKYDPLGSIRTPLCHLPRQAAHLWRSTFR